MLYEDAHRSWPPFALQEMPPQTSVALQLALRRASGLMIFAAGPRHAAALARLREVCRAQVPVVSQYQRFDLVDALAEDVRGLLRVGLKGDAVDVGLVCANAFEALRVLAALGVPPVMLGSEAFIAGIVHARLVRRIANPQEAAELREAGDAALIERVSMGLGGADARVRLRSPHDEGTWHWYVDVLLPDPRMGELLERGSFGEAWRHWLALASELPWISAHAAALLDVEAGLIDPRDFEAEFGPIHWQHAVHDRVLQGYEIARA